MDWSRDNLPGFSADKPWKWLLLPGVVIQWLMYMFPRSGLTEVAKSYRHAKSPIMTVLYSLSFYGLIVILIASSLSTK